MHLANFKRYSELHGKLSKAVDIEDTNLCRGIYANRATSKAFHKVLYLQSSLPPFEGKVM